MDLYQKKKLTRDFCRCAIGIMAILPARLPVFLSEKVNEQANSLNEDILEKECAQIIENPYFLEYVSEKYKSYGAALHKAYIDSEAIGIWAAALQSSQGDILFLSEDLLNPANGQVLDFLLGHEASHSVHNDIEYSVLSGANSLVYSGLAAITALTNLLFTAILASPGTIGAAIPVCLTAAAILARGLDLAHTRQAEYLADLRAVAVNGDEQTAIDIFEQRMKEERKHKMRARRHQSYLQRAYNVSKRLFSDHPALDKRIAAIREYKASQIMPG